MAQSPSEPSGVRRQSVRCQLHELGLVASQHQRRILENRCDLPGMRPQIPHPSLQSGHAPGCFCNRGGRWSSPKGHARCLSMLTDRYGAQYDASRMNWVWWQANVKDAFSKVDVTCRECGHRSRSTCLANLQSGPAPGCFCNIGWSWSSPEGHARCLSMPTDRYGPQYNASRMN